MKKRKTIERWLADIFNTPDLIKKADEKDKRLDKRYSPKPIQEKPSWSDWRTLSREK